MKKIFFTALLFVLGSSYVMAQEKKVEIKNDKVLADGVAILKYEKINAIQHSFYSLQNDDEILLLRIFNNETPDYVNDDYFSLNFLTEKVKVETGDFSHIAAFMNSKKSMEKLVKWLLKEKVLNADGTLNHDKLEIFYEKYNEDITARTVR